MGRHASQKCFSLPYCGRQGLRVPTAPWWQHWNLHSLKPMLWLWCWQAQGQVTRAEVNRQAGATVHGAHLPVCHFSRTSVSREWNHETSIETVSQKHPSPTNRQTNTSSTGFIFQELVVAPWKTTTNWSSSTSTGEQWMSGAQSTRWMTTCTRQRFVDGILAANMWVLSTCQASL